MVKTYEILNENNELKDVPITSLITIAEQELIISEYDSIVVEEDIELIPNIIHYCWFGGVLPDQQKRMIEIVQVRKDEESARQ